MADDTKIKRTLTVEGGDEAFLCDSATVSHNNALFVLDLRQNVPLFVPEHKNLTIKQTHKTVLMTPAMAKEFRRILDVQLEQFEKEIGGIKVAEKKKEKTAPKEEEYHHYG